MLKDTYPYYLANDPVAANTDLVVTNKYTSEPATRVALADAATIDEAIGASVRAFDQTRKTPAFQRKAVVTVGGNGDEVIAGGSVALAVYIVAPRRNPPTKGDAAVQLCQ